MYLLNIKFFRYCVKFKSNVNNKKAKNINREGIVFKIIDLRNNTFIWSETAPLPYFSLDFLKFSYFEILRFKQIIVSFTFLSWRRLFSNRNLFLKLSEEKIFPCLHCCITLGIYNLIRYRSKRLVNIRKTTTRLNSLVNFNLLLLNKENNLNTFNQFGNSVVKFKLRNLTFIDVFINFTFLVKYRNLCCSKKIRLDTNRTFSLEQNFYLFQRLALHNLDYLEEPINQVRDVFALISELNCPTVLDELSRSFQSLAFDYSNLVGFVIKPSMMGSLRLILDLINLNFLTYKFSILSSIFETNCSVINFLLLLIDLDLNLPVGFGNSNSLIDDFIVSSQELSIRDGYLFLYLSKNVIVNIKEVVKLWF
nr:4-(2'-carboxyphenyl)-4-oxybutyric acid synthase [Cyanidium caldarium]